MPSRSKQEAPQPPEGLATPAQAADFLAIGLTKLYEMMADGTLHSVPIGRSRRIPWAALRDLAARGTEQP